MLVQEVNYNRPLHRVRNSETEEITISDWFDNYENDDVPHILLQVDCNLQSLLITKLKFLYIAKYFSFVEPI